MRVQIIHPRPARQRGLLLLVLLGMLLPGLSGSAATPVPPRERIAIRGVVESQLQAFRHDDAAAAFSRASPAIQATYGTPERFMRMVRDAYRAVYRPRSYTFEPVVVVRGKIVQPLLVVGPEGEVVIALYLMERQPDGTWKINGVRLLRTEAMSA